MLLKDDTKANRGNNKVNETLKQIKTILTILVFLVILNIMFTYLVYSKYCEVTYNFKNSITGKKLPAFIDSEKDNLGEFIIKYWNEKDTEKLYGLLGNIVKEHLAFADFEQQINALSHLGRIEKADYVNYQYNGVLNSHDMYDLFYSIKIDSKIGRLTLSIIDTGGTYEVTGFNIFKDFLEEKE